MIPMLKRVIGSFAEAIALARRAKRRSPILEPVVQNKQDCPEESGHVCRAGLSMWKRSYLELFKETIALARRAKRRSPVPVSSQ